MGMCYSDEDVLHSKSIEEMEEEINKIAKTQFEILERRIKENALYHESK